MCTRTPVYADASTLPFACSVLMIALLELSWARCVCVQLDPDCTATLKQAGLIARPGQAFGSSVSHARLALLMRAQAFDHMADKLRMMG